MQQADYEALVWVRDHTDTNALLISDRSVLCGLDNYMFHGTFSERQMYLEGDRYFYGTYLEERERRRNIIVSLYDNGGDAFDVAVQDGVKYIIQTKWLTPDYKGTVCSLLYETDTMRIWKIDG